MKSFEEYERSHLKNHTSEEKVMTTFVSEATGLVAEFENNPSQEVMGKIQAFLASIAYWLKDSWKQEYANGGTPESRPVEEAVMAEELLQPFVKQVENN